jgi:hypothetical protein
MIIVISLPMTYTIPALVDAAITKFLLTKRLFPIKFMC